MPHSEQFILLSINSLFRCPPHCRSALQLTHKLTHVFIYAPHYPLQTPHISFALLIRLFERAPFLKWSPASITLFGFMYCIISFYFFAPFRAVYIIILILILIFHFIFPDALSPRLHTTHKYAQ